MEDNKNNVTNNTLNNEEKILNEKGDNMKKRNYITIITIILLIVAAFVIFIDKDMLSGNIKVENNDKHLAYRLSGNSLEDFDLYFLQLENEKKNKVYSPLSIKYALAMLNEGAKGETKEQISNIIGDYNSKKYIDSKNMSFANALFIKNSYKNSIKDSYINTLTNKYNADVIYDSFVTPNNLNSWVSNKTFKLIDNMFEDVSNEDFILVNALAIDMEWVNQIQSENKEYSVYYAHENFVKVVDSLNGGYYHSLEFNDNSSNASSVEIGAVINKYDIVNTLGENTIRETVGNEYKKWLADENSNFCGSVEDELDVDSYLDKYIKEINEGYKDISSSTDFTFYVDGEVKAFAKDLKEYNGTTLQYIGIMPKNDSLDNYITNTNASKINTLISKLKTVELNNFKEGVITEITGYIPMFKFKYELNLVNDLNKLGITDVFEIGKADLSNLTKDNVAISNASHKANIEFSNDGIKAGAATGMGGRGAGGCGFDYKYDVPVEQIDLTFDKPYMFIIRDKNTGEVWFTGTVYEPTEYQDPSF